MGYTKIGVPKMKDVLKIRYSNIINLYLIINLEKIRIREMIGDR